MGAAASTRSASNVSLDQLIADTLSLFTLYDPNATITVEEVDFAQQSWDMITKDTSPEYLHLKENDATLKSFSCLSWFYDKFYEFSQSLDCESHQLYKNNLRVQVNALIAMINMTLTMFKSDNIVEKVTSGMTKLAIGHYKRGVRSYQYAMVGIILIKTFKHCLGNEFAEEVSTVWSKMFSIMLKVLIPASIKVEEEEDAKDPSTGLSMKRKFSSGTDVSTHISLNRSFLIVDDVPMPSSLNRGASAGNKTSTTNTAPLLVRCVSAGGTVSKQASIRQIVATDSDIISDSIVGVVDPTVMMPLAVVRVIDEAKFQTAVIDSTTLDTGSVSKAVPAILSNVSTKSLVVEKTVVDDAIIDATRSNSIDEEPLVISE